MYSLKIKQAPESLRWLSLPEDCGQSLLTPLAGGSVSQRPSQKCARFPLFDACFLPWWLWHHHLLGLHHFTTLLFSIALFSQSLLSSSFFCLFLGPQNFPSRLLQATKCTKMTQLPLSLTYRCLMKRNWKNEKAFKWSVGRRWKKCSLQHHKPNGSKTKQLKKAVDSSVPGHLQKIKLLQRGLLPTPQERCAISSTWGMAVLCKESCPTKQWDQQEKHPRATSTNNIVKLIFFAENVELYECSF